jgi:hypothetical protein
MRRLTISSVAGGGDVAPFQGAGSFRRVTQAFCLGYNVTPFQGGERNGSPKGIHIIAHRESVDLRPKKNAP